MYIGQKKENITEALKIVMTDDEKMVTSETHKYSVYQLGNTETYLAFDHTDTCVIQKDVPGFNYKAKYGLN